MMFDSVMPDFDLTTITGKQEFRKWFTGAVRNEIRSYTPEALGVSTSIGNVENTISNFSNVPTGIISPFGGLVAPNGWLLCNGSQVSQVTYASLYAVLGVNAYGTDSGGNFYLPDLQGRTVVGLGTNAATNARTDNDNIAEASRAPSHTHTGNDHSHDSGSFYTRIVPSPPGVWYGQYSSNGETWVNNWNGGGLSLVNNAIGNTFGGGLDVSGSSGGSSDRGMTTATMPYGIANYIIKT